MFGNVENDVDSLVLRTHTAETPKSFKETCLHAKCNAVIKILDDSFQNHKE